MNATKKLIIAGLAGAALVAAGATFVPGTAEAHCGDHSGSCSWQSYAVGQWCEGLDLWVTYEVYSGYCAQPVANCSPGVTCPCAAGACSTGVTHGCYWYTYDSDTGPDYDCL